jgi:hypothetical protein
MSAANQFPVGSDPAALVIAGENDDLIAEAANESVAQTVRETAFAAASEGMRLFPLRSGQKFPPPEGWQALATTDADTISRWLTPLTSGSDLLSDAPPNIGVLCGNGLMVLDLDPRNGSDESFTALEAKYGKLPRTRTATTPSGGTHYYFKVPVDREIRNDNRGKVGAGIDIKSNGGYVVLPGSSTEKGSYSWIDPPAPIAELPAQLLELVTQPRAPRTAVNTSATTAETPKHNLTVADARELLKHLDADCDYGTWFDICVAARRAAKGAQDGSALVDWFLALNEWSARSSKYRGRAEVEEKWRQADTRESGYGLKHLIDLAKSSGYVPPPHVASIDMFPPVTVGPAPAARFKPVIPNLAAPRPKWLVKNLLVEGSLAILFGRWGTGKSTVAIELGIAVARALPWHNRKVRGGKVVYISCENPHGVRSRLSAALKDQGIALDDLHGNFLEIADRPHLLKPEEVQALIAQLKAIGPIALVVVDTLARATAGAEENSAKDSGILVGNCQAISEATGACVMLIHHTGKDESRGMRGSSNLPASADTEIELERPSETENVRIAKLGKQRDAPDYCELFHYELAAVTLCQDEDGDPITSTVVREIEPQSEIEITSEAPKHPIRRAVWSTLDNAMRPMGVEELITSSAASLVHDPASGKRDRRRDRVRQAIEGMAQEGRLSRSPEGLYELRRPEVVDSATSVHERFSPVISPAANDSAANGDLVGGAL